MSWGDFPLGETLNHFFTTRAFATGVPTVLAGTPVLSVYEDTNLTQITSGVTVTVSADSVVGLNRANIIATSGNGYETGKSYTVVITTGTVGGVSVIGEVVGEFTIERSATYKRLGAPAGASLAADIIAMKAETVLIVGDTNQLQVDWVNGGRLDLLLDAIPTTAMRGTDNAALASEVTAARMATLTDWINGGRLDIILDAINSVVSGLQTTIGTAGAGLIDITINGASVDLFWNAILKKSTYNIAKSAGKRLRKLDESFEVHEGTAQSGTTNTITLDTGASSVNGIYNGDRIVIINGTGAQEHGIVIDYDGPTKIATMHQNWAVIPDNTSDFSVVPANCDVVVWVNNPVTVSANGVPDMNVKEANGVPVTGTGASGDEWGP